MATDGFDIRKLRNIGIIAHIDAGKTTTTERILYYTGSKHKMGEVDDGTTTTDFDSQEQERGITIRAAAITCRWKDIRINIIDTPGHVDFTAEVERSLRVLDGGVVIFSAVEGVEAQSETVWHQADRYKVPRLCFINKLDRTGADFFRVYDEIGERLGAKLIPLQIPIGGEKEFLGVCSLMHADARAYFFDETSLGKNVNQGVTPESLMPTWQLWRDKMIEALADADESVMELYLAGEDVPDELIVKAVRKATIEHAMTPLLCGSSLKYVGVQPLLDAVADFLPCPLDVPLVVGINPVTQNEETRTPSEGEPFTGFLFKISADKHEELCFVKVYSGTLKPSTRLLNATRNKKENVTQIWHIQADEKIKVDLARAGDIVGLVGLKDSVTGDTLCDPKHPLVLQRITFPRTVISQSIEPKSSADKEKFLQILALMQKVDPTFVAQVSSDTGQLLISGMGELHLEVVCETMRRDFKLKIRTGKPRVSYRETIKRTATATGECDRTIAAGPIYAKVTIELAKHKAGPGGEPFLFLNKLPGEAIPFEMQGVIEDACRQECTGGGMAGYPLTEIQATLVSAEYRDGASNEQAYRFAVAAAVRQALEQAGIDILEPVMKLEVATPEDFIGEITSDLGARRAMIQDISMRGMQRIIVAAVPLREMFGYSTRLRSLSQGRASYSMEPLDYQPAPGDVTKELLGS